MLQQNALGIPTSVSLTNSEEKYPYAFTGHEAFALHVNLMKLYHKHDFICPSNI
jgi:hypothetical protein